MFQYEADNKWGLSEIAMGLARLAVSWTRFLIWRIATVMAELCSPARWREAIRSRKAKKSRRGHEPSPPEQAQSTPAE